MLTTRRPDRHLDSRALTDQKKAAAADLWFVTAQGTGTLRDLQAVARVNVSSYKDPTRDWVTVSALTTISRDRQKIRELYAVGLYEIAKALAGRPDAGDRGGAPDFEARRLAPFPILIAALPPTAR